MLTMRLAVVCHRASPLVFVCFLLCWFMFRGVSSSTSSADEAGGNESDGSEFEESSSVGHQERLKLKILLQLVKNMARSKARVVRQPLTPPSRLSSAGFVLSPLPPLPLLIGSLF